MVFSGYKDIIIEFVVFGENDKNIQKQNKMSLLIA